MEGGLSREDKSMLSDLINKKMVIHLKNEKCIGSNKGYELILKSLGKQFLKFKMNTSNEEYIVKIDDISIFHVVEQIPS